MKHSATPDLLREFVEAMKARLRRLYPVRRLDPRNQARRVSRLGVARRHGNALTIELLRLNGKDLRDLPIEERKAKLEELLKKPPGVIRYSVSFPKDIPELLERARKLGLEGLIGKRAGSR